MLGPSNPTSGKRRTKKGKRKRIDDPSGAAFLPGNAPRAPHAHPGGGSSNGTGNGGAGAGAALALASPDIAAEHTPEHAAERARMLEALAEYRKREARLKAEGRSKPDMISYKETKIHFENTIHYDIAARQRWGRVPGTIVGESLIGRCEVAITVGPYTRTVSS